MLCLAVEQLAILEPDHVITGMARGWDMEIAGACIALGIPFTAAVPFPGQADHWAEQARHKYNVALALAAEVVTLYPRYEPDVYRWRDEWMVDHGDLVLSLLDPDAPIQSGTGMTVRYANRKSVPVLNCWNEWLAIRPRAG